MVVKYANGLKINICAKSLKAIFQRRPQKSVKEVALAGFSIIGRTAMPIFRQRTVKTSNNPKCNKKISPIIPHQPANIEGEICLATTHNKTPPNTIFKKAFVRLCEDAFGSGVFSTHSFSSIPTHKKKNANSRQPLGLCNAIIKMIILLKKNIPAVINHITTQLGIEVFKIPFIIYYFPFFLPKLKIAKITKYPIFLCASVCSVRNYFFLSSL